LALDIGGGTQDILIYDPRVAIENCVQLILPAPTVLVARQISWATSERQAVFLTGNLMGGGACVRAIRKHLEAGLAVWATPASAKTIADDLSWVEALGVKLAEDAPPGAVIIRTGDVDLERLEKALGLYGVELPGRVAIAVQDHGERIGMSNRLFRFQHWRAFLERGGKLEWLVYDRSSLPPYLTRMKAALDQVSGALVMDTVAAAFWGALEDEVVRQHRQKGVVLVNVGNQHTTAGLYRDGELLGLFEHHTAAVEPQELAKWVSKLRAGTLTHEEIFATGGHGAYIRSDYRPGQGFELVAITGPRRELARELGGYFAAPYGDMMLTGCFGLVAASSCRS
jgi:uncharacterized protein (DUF1786 family)